MELGEEGHGGGGEQVEGGARGLKLLQEQRGLQEVKRGQEQQGSYSQH